MFTIHRWRKFDEHGHRSYVGHTTFYLVSGAPKFRNFFFDHEPRSNRELKNCCWACSGSMVFEKLMQYPYLRYIHDHIIFSKLGHAQRSRGGKKFAPTWDKVFKVGNVIGILIQYIDWSLLNHDSNNNFPLCRTAFAVISR